jgi:hypothetical protein
VKKKSVDPSFAFCNKTKNWHDFLPLISLGKPRGASFDDINIFKNENLTSENVKGLGDVSVVEVE